MKKKCLISFIVAAMMCGQIVATGLTANAASTTVRTIDNDSIASGYSNEDVRSIYTYITANSLYNGDARRASSNNSLGEYYYKYPSLGVTGKGSPATFTIHVGAYLNHATFTDTSAKYYVEYAPYVFQRVGAINQNTAPGGWNYISKSNVQSAILVETGVKGGFSGNEAYVNPSGLSGKYTGADGLKVWFTY